jgi:citrate synthase
MSSRKVKIKSRNEEFTLKIKSEITEEVSSSTNVFLPEDIRIHGYSVLDLMMEHDYMDVFYLLYKGELPSVHQKEILRKLSVFVINLGPRHASSRAAANAGVGRTDVNHIVPIAVMGMGGGYGGSKEVENSMRFIKSNFHNDPRKIALECIKKKENGLKGDEILSPGFGTDFGGQSPFLLKVKNKFLTLTPKLCYLDWSENFVTEALLTTTCGWRYAGVVASILLDLEFEPREGGGIFQMLACPGAFAHGIQFANKPITDIPFLNDEHYEIKN